jgi:FAD/FMN-containing dehydrogenase
MSDFQTFKSAFSGDIVTPEDANYRSAIARWAANAERRAKVVAFVKNTDDVALAIQYAKTNQLAITIKGGGHNPMGASSVEGGLVVDLSRYFRKVRVDAEKRLAYVGGGSLWEDVDKEAIKYGLATVGGTVNDVSFISFSALGNVVSD